MAAASKCAPHARRGSSGEAPRAPGSASRALHTPRRVPPASVCPSQAGLWAAVSVRRGQSARTRSAARALGPPGPQGPLPAPDVRQRLARRPRPEPLPQVAAGAVLVVVLGLRVPEQHGWSSRPHDRRAAPTQAAPPSHGHLEEPSPGRGAGRPASLWTAQGAGLAEPCPQALPPHLAGPHPRALPGSKGASSAPERPEGAARPRIARVGLR